MGTGTILVAIGTYIIEYWIYYLYCSAIFPRRRSLGKTILLGAGLYAICAVLFITVYHVVLNILTSFVGNLLIVFVCFRAPRVKGIITTVIHSAVLNLAEWLTINVLAVVTGEVFNAQSAPLSMWILIVLISKTMLLLMSIFIARFVFAPKGETRERTPAFLFILPVSAVFIDVAFWKAIAELPASSAAQWMTAIGSFVLLVSVMLTYVFYGNALRRSRELYRTEEELRHAKAHIRTQAEHYDALYRYQTETRKMRHDERNKLLALSGLLRSGDTEKAAAMLDEELATIETAAERVVDTGNPVLDAVLQSKRDDAQKQGVTLRVRTQTEESIRIDELQLGVLLGNAVDNAVEAAAKVDDPHTPRTVDVTLQTRMGRILIGVENPTVEESGDVGALRTGKDDPYRHGFGLQSIRSIVAEHDGTLSITWKDHVFRLEAGLANNA